MFLPLKVCKRNTRMVGDVVSGKANKDLSISAIKTLRKTHYQKGYGVSHVLPFIKEVAKSVYDLIDHLLSCLTFQVWNFQFLIKK